MNASPERIVSLSASNTEILCALGLEDRLVGVDAWSDYPASVQRLPKVGRELDIDVGAVAALRPDLVVACRSIPGMERNLAALDAAGLPYITLQPVGLESIFENIRQAGQATGREQRAAELVGALTERLAAVHKAIAATRKRPSVYWEWWPKPFIAAGGRSWMTQLIAMAGGANVFADRDAESVTVEAEEVLRRGPEVILACWCGARTPPKAGRVAGRAGWAATPAVRDGRVHVLPEAYFARPGPRLADGLELLAALLHPERAGRSAANA